MADPHVYSINSILLPDTRENYMGLHGEMAAEIRIESGVI